MGIFRIIFVFVAFSTSFISCGIRTFNSNAKKIHKPKTLKILSQEQQKIYDSIFFAAIHFKNQNDDLNANAAFQQMNKINPSEPFPYYSIAKYQIENNNNIPKARDYAAVAFELRPENKFYRTFYADLLTSSGQIAKGAALYRELIDRGDYSMENFYKLLIMYDYGKYYEKMHEVINLMDAHTGIDNIYLETLKLEVFRKEKNNAAIEHSLQNLMRMEPDNKNYKILLVEYYDQNNMTEKADSLYNTISFREGNDEDQITYFYSLVQRKDTTRLFEIMDEAYLVKNKKNNIYKNLQLSLLTSSEKFPYIIEPYVRKVTKITESDSEIIPEGAEFLYGYYESLGNKDSMLKYAQKSVDLGTGNVSIFNYIISPYFEGKLYDSVIAKSHQALINNDSLSIAHYTIAIAYYFLEQNDSVVKYMQNALTTAGSDYNNIYRSELYGSIGDAQERLKNYNKSEEAYDSALSINPENATVLNNYAYYLSVRGERLEDALAMSSKSLELRKDDPTFLDTYGWIYYKMGKYEEAKIYIKKAIEKSDNPSADLYDHMGDIELKLNNLPAAIDNWKKALNANEDNKELKEKIYKYE